jgi:hypothetical protein
MAEFGPCGFHWSRRATTARRSFLGERRPLSMEVGKRSPKARRSRRPSRRKRTKKRSRGGAQSRAAKLRFHLGGGVASRRPRGGVAPTSVTLAAPPRGLPSRSRSPARLFDSQSTRRGGGAPRRKTEAPSSRSTRVAGSRVMYPARPSGSRDRQAAVPLVVNRQAQRGKPRNLEATVDHLVARPTRAARGSPLRRSRSPRRFLIPCCRAR